MELLIIGIVTGFNVLVIIYKYNAGRESESVLDLILFGVVVYMTAGSLGGMQVGMIASAIVSMYLYFNPPKFLSE